MTILLIHSSLSLQTLTGCTNRVTLKDLKQNVGDSKWASWSWISSCVRSKQPHKDYTYTIEENIMFADKYWCDKNAETGISQT